MRMILSRWLITKKLDKFQKGVDKPLFYCYNIDIEKRKTEKQKGREKKMMYTVWTYDDATCDDEMVFEGTLTECISYVDGDTEFYIVEPDGFTVYE